jgi:3',5'-cyclic AMP phosphodiesterase CpdA
MSRILHLSDLHLGEPLQGQYLDSHKTGMAGDDRRAQRDVLRETLAALGEDGTLASIDAVVISGDLTNKGRPDGFEQFKEFSNIITAHVDAAKVVVVPGNHDMPQQHPPGEPDRYQEFLAATRDLGFVTPLLDGHDFEVEGKLNEAGKSSAHLLIGPGFEIIALNSSHFCWGHEPLPDDVFEALLTVPEAELLEATKKMRMFDVARISNAQMAALEELLKDKDAGRLRNGDDSRVRIAVLHHQLLPVSPREEFKSFESLTNLGAVREFLTSLGVDVVMHGHKHESALFWDSVPDPQRLAMPPARVLIEAAPGDFQEGSRVARILEIGPRTGARDIAVHDVLSASRRGGGIRKRSVGLAQLWDRPVARDSASARTVRGETVTQVYARVQSLFDASNGQPLHYLICEVEDPSDAGDVPADYPPPDGISDVERWMSDLVKWWQLPDPKFGHGVEFNHGNRIYRRWGNQLERAIDLFNAKGSRGADTTRAVILLLDPQGEASATKGEFPSFVLVQFQLVQEGADWRLDCTGYFRKQEMRYWWPINARELALIQSEVANGVRLDGDSPRVGVLRTITAFALAADRLPVVVAVPAIDRAVDQHLEELWMMAHGLVDPDGVRNKEEMRQTWSRYLAELEPTEDDELAIPRRGLQTILLCIEAIDAPENAATVALGELVRFYGLFAQPAGASKVEAPKEAQEKLDGLSRQLDALFGGLGESAG